MARNGHEGTGNVCARRGMTGGSGVSAKEGKWFEQGEADGWGRTGSERERRAARWAGSLAGLRARDKWALAHFGLGLAGCQFFFV